MDKECVMAVDLGGTKADIALIESGNIIREKIRLHVKEYNDKDALIQALVTAMVDMLSRSEMSVGCCGVAVAGQVDPGGREILFAPNLQWRSVPLAALIEEGTGLKTTLINDVRAAVWGEWKYGAAKGAQDAISLFIGTGIGGGIISCHQIVSGCNNAAGELGHLVVMIDGPQCTCGNHGCLEAIASGWAIAKAAKNSVGKDPELGAAIVRQAKGADITAEHVTMCAKRGDPLACLIMDRALQALVAGVISIANAFNPERLILGGGVFLGQEAWLEKIDKAVRIGALKAATDKLKVVSASLGVHAGLIGAGIVARDLCRGV
jgi:glucokinase